MQSPQVGSILVNPHSRESSIQRKLSWQSHQSASVHNMPVGAPQSVASVASTTNTIDFYRKTTIFGKYGGYVALFGGFLFQLTLGSWFCFGNLIPYVAAYMANNVNAEHSFTLNDDELAALYTEYISHGNIVFFIAMIMNAICCIFGGNLELQLGPTKTLLITGILISFGFGLTYFGLVWNSFAVIYITFGFLFGAGVGLGYPVQPIVCMRWFPEKRGIVNGYTSALFGAGPFIFNPIQSKLVNPMNIAMDDRLGFSKNQEVLDRIPVMFVYFAAIMLSMQFLSLFMIRSPPWFTSAVEASAGGGAHGGGISKSQLKYEANSLTMRQSLSFMTFWLVFVTCTLYTVVMTWLTAEWKVFASGYMGITDDGLLSYIGSISALSNGVGRFLWGVAYDIIRGRTKHSFRLAQGIQSCMCTVFCLTIPFVRIEGDERTTAILLTIWLVVLWSNAGCNYSFLPSMLMETFGAKHAGELIGIMIVAEPLATGLVVCLSSISFLMEHFEYYAWIVGCCSGITIILAIVTDLDRVDRKAYLSKQQVLKKEVTKYDAV